MKILARVVAYTAFAAVTALFSIWPQYRMMDSSEALVSLTFSHAGQRVGECRKLTQEELNELPPNMRKPEECPRARHPLYLLLKIDQQPVYEAVLHPSGLWADGKSDVYQRLQVRAGRRKLWVGMRDSGRASGFDHVQETVRDISPGSNVIIGFDELNRRFEIQ